MGSKTGSKDTPDQKVRRIGYFRSAICFCAILWFGFTSFLQFLFGARGHVNGLQFKVLAVVLYISLYFQGVWPSGTFSKWDRFAMIVTFPLASVVYVIGQSFLLVGMIIASLAAGAAGLLIVAVVIFITVGLFGILLFGVRQVF